MMPSDRPDDQIIEDDVGLDKWYDSYQREIMKKAGKNKTTSAAEFTTVPTFEMTAHE